MTESIGDRVYMVRRALGPNARTELPLREFAELLSKASGTSYDASELSKMERDKRGISLEDVAAIAFVDPEKRGRYWLAWGKEEEKFLADIPISHGPAISREEAARGKTNTRDERRRGA